MENILFNWDSWNLSTDGGICRSSQTDSNPQTDPFHEAKIRSLTERGLVALELSMMRARLESSIANTVELFCLVAENSPEMLPEPWATVADVIASEERLWVYPQATVGQVEDGHREAFMPHLHRAKVAAEWPRLLEHARRVHACRESGKTHGYEA